ncbi:hypothetical protein RHGRI_007088 [Rhododendron griersonianum]|uniref:Poly A polymerase head domain-containing protein n=1 Tax=Rhododendron griersonianum TaxID=479676 RepID=A0AAV6KX24_9ERIC|nr:hypothetical protein RHGRI_007088 [Rhododendron griersonianum]
MRIVSSAHRFFSFQTPPPPSLSSIPKPSLLPTLRPIQFKNIIKATPLRFRFLALGLSHYLRAMSTTTTTEDPASSAPSVQVRDRIDLTDKERLIFGRLLEVLRHFSLQTQLRVAGGWVRDKLLGRDCYDIDIAIDNMLGKEFCEKVNEYLSSKGEEAHGIGVIQCNPDQSKHLETARMRLFDVWIDVVNLRSEDYSENSRIPTMRFGTAEEDAYRRDLTINSLFYNINTSSVEDFTRRGIADLKSGKIVTPLPAKETFLDDPLRVLRAIRFGARFGFTLDGELKKAASDDDVKAAIADKISRERVGHEIDLMVSGSQPVKAISYVLDLLLFWVVFSLPPEVDPPTFQVCESLDRICVTHMDAAWNLMQLIGCSAFNDEQRRLGLYATLFLPLRSTTYKDNKSKKVPVVNYIFRNSLKLKASDAETVINVHNATKKLLSLIPLILSNPEDIKIAEVDWGRVTLDVPVASKLRILAGLLLREIKDFWRVALLASVLLYPTNIDDTKDSSAGQFQLEKRSQTFKIVENAITDLGLEKVWEMKPLVNGKDIMSILQLKAGGPLVREWQQKLLEWQLAHPSGTSEECLDWMRQTNSKRARVE